MTIDEIKARQLAGQHLTAAAEPLSVVRDLCGIQAQFMTNVFHALKLRCGDGAGTDGLVKSWTLRGTVHVFAEADLPLFLAGAHYRSHDWTVPSFWNTRPDWALTPPRQEALSRVILDALAEGPRTREELKTLCREAGMTGAEESSMFHPWGGGVQELCERGFLHYAPVEEKVFCLTPVCSPLPEEEAELELARRYFTRFGPATVRDARYFFRAPAAKVRKWLSALPVREADCGGRKYFYIETGADIPQNIPRCLFLAGFDQLMLGYEKKESLYLAPEHLRSIFSLAGIVSPALLLDGRVVGRWKRRGAGVRVELFTPAGPGERAAVREAAEGLWGEGTKLVFSE